MQAVHSTVTKIKTKKMTNFLVKNEKQWRKCPKKCQKKHYESQVENKLVSKPNKYGTLVYFITNNLYVFWPSLEGKYVIIYNWCFFLF